MLYLDPIQTLAFAGIVVFAGQAACRRCSLLQRYNLPASVVGGLVVAALLAALRIAEMTPLTFDTTLQKPLLSAFFTSIGFRVSIALLQRGSRALLLLLMLSTLVAILQNAVGIVAAIVLGQPPLFGVMCGSVTLTGGPATGLAFAPQFEAAGIAGAESIAIVAAIFGIVAAGMFGAPISTILIERLPDKAYPYSNRASTPVTRELRLGQSTTIDPFTDAPAEYDIYSFNKNVIALLIAMGLGTWVSNWLTTHVLTLPIYMGGMLVAAVIRNLDDATSWIGLSQRTFDQIGDLALSLFLVMALMSLELWKLASLAVPMAAVLVIQVVLTVGLSIWLLFPQLGRDYDAAVTAGGFYGYMTGITANAMASMDAVVNRYGPAPVAYLVVPVVGAFFIDFANALLIQGCLNLFR